MCAYRLHGQWVLYQRSLVPRTIQWRHRSLQFGTQRFDALWHETPGGPGCAGAQSRKFPGQSQPICSKWLEWTSTDHIHLAERRQQYQVDRACQWRIIDATHSDANVQPDANADLDANV